MPVTFFDRIVLPTGYQRIDEFSPSTQIDFWQNSEPSIHLPTLLEYELKLIFGMKFACNRQDRPVATRMAEQTILRAVYEPFRDDLYRLLMMIQSGNRSEAMGLVGSLIDRINQGELGIGKPIRRP